MEITINEKTIKRLAEIEKDINTLNGVKNNILQTILEQEDVDLEAYTISLQENKLILTEKGDD